jgi:hypothetical protein
VSRKREARDERWPEASRPLGGLALGYLAALPLVLLYEWGVAAGGPEGPRSTAELLLGSGLAPLGERAAPARWVLLTSLAVVAWVQARRSETSLARDLGRVWAGGLVAALALGPLLLWLVHLAGVTPAGLGVAAPRPGVAPDLAQSARLVGSAFWEECLFRVAGFGALWFLAARVARFLGAPAPLASVAGELAGLLLSSFLFAAFHLASWMRPLGIAGGLAGEPFDAGTFLWRLFAGLALAGLYRWRGLGAAAWAHALFNLGLVHGAGPVVFLG